MSFWEKMKNMILSGDDDDYEPIVDESSDSDNVDIGEERRNREVKISTTAKFQMVLFRPKDLSELQAIGTELNQQKVVLLNLELVSKDVGQRILDYLQGNAQANQATFKKTAQDTFVFMPKNVEFSGIDLMSELEAGGYNFN